MQSKELVLMLTERGYEIKSASSTIDNITAEALIEELKPETSGDEEATPEPQEVEEVDQENVGQEESDSSEVSATPIVKSKEDVERERLEKQSLIPRRATKPPTTTDFQISLAFSHKALSL